MYIFVKDTQQIQIDWQRPDNSSLPPTAYIRGGTLYIHDVQPSAAGLYKCLGYDRSTNRLVFSLNSYLEVICKYWKLTGKFETSIQFLL